MGCGESEESCAAGASGKTFFFLLQNKATWLCSVINSCVRFEMNMADEREGE